MRDAFDLPRRDQLALYEQLRAYLGDAEIGQSDQRDERIEAHSLVVECLEKAAAHLDLDLATEPITSRRYQEAKKSLGLPLSAAQIGRICGRWRAGVALARGHWVPENVRQKALRRKLHPRYRTDTDYLADVRAFLASKPEKPSAISYETWRRDEQRRGTHRYEAGSIRNNIGRPWTEIIAGASSGEFPALKLDELGEFIPKRTAVAILGLTDPQRLDHDARYPNPVFRGGNVDFYLTKDIVAFSEGRVVPERERFEYQERYMTQNELGSRLGFCRETVYDRLAKKNFKSIPEPAFHLPGVAVLWLRSDVERFIATRNRRKSASRAKKARRTAR